MLYAILCYNDEAAVEAWPKAKDDAVIARRRVVTDKLAEQGRLGPVLRLMNTTAATTVRYGAEPVVMDGPFAETKEQLLGLYVIDVASLEDAIEVARGMAGRDGDGGSGAFEIRPLRAFIPDTVQRETMIS
ncbi:MAG: YciI family protein [Ferrovibrio sp.]|uniref:YciI family protein n=1 Tax=Ferrovibrio sp. TaxID=1917215 RepID=UPI00262918B9|nr:YciI family protein [Ferrovibrio sp.]MCW0232290.1 YciI family protein [Ferrovibrio sp.]